MVYITESGWDYTPFVETEEDVKTFERIAEIDRIMLSGNALSEKEQFDLAREIIILDSKIKGQAAFIIEPKSAPRNVHLN